MKKFLLHWAPVALYMTIIFFVSTRPMPERLPRIWQLDKALHLGAYFVMGYMWARALAAALHAQEREVTRRIIFLSFIISLLYGLFIEVCQHLIPERSFSLADGAADGIGGFLGAGFYGRCFLAAGDDHGYSRTSRPETGGIKDDY